MPRNALAPGLAFVLAIAAEYGRATTAAHRYEQLRRMASVQGNTAANAARRVYMEFYSEGLADRPRTDQGGGHSRLCVCAPAPLVN